MTLMRPGALRVIRSLAPALFACVLATPAAAQLVTGRIIADGTDDGIADVALTLTDSAGVERARTVSDSAGRFRVLAPHPGTYRIHAAHIGYSTVETAVLTVPLRTELQVELRMSTAAVALEPLRVVGRAAFNAGWLQEFYDRAMWTRRTGSGRVFFRDEIERSELPRASTYLVHLMPRAQCRPAVYVDGLPVSDAAALDTAIRPDQLEGVELYNNPSLFPQQYQNRGHCALAFFWTRRDMGGGDPPGWRRILAVTGVLAVLLLLTQL